MFNAKFLGVVAPSCAWQLALLPLGALGFLSLIAKQ